MKSRSTYLIKAGEGLSFSDFKRMESLEETFYSHDFITPAEEAFRWYEMHPRSIVAAFDGNEIAGFVNVLPLAGEMLERALAGELNDAELTAEDIPAFETLGEQTGDESFALFLSCIVTNEGHRGTGLAQMLLSTALELYAPPARNETWVITDNVTPDGCRFSERMGFSFLRPTAHGSKLYAISLGELYRSLQTSGSTD